MFIPHPSERLSALFRLKPYQGVEPEAATFLFVGLDANYSESIESSKSFTYILDYHEDGVKFWRKHGVHHPFLMPEYRGDGQRYHRNFAKVGFESKHAQLVSFIELLHIPTVGRSGLVVNGLNKDHLIRLNNAMLNGAARHIFISAGVARLMRSSNVFAWLSASEAKPETLPVLFQDGNRTVYQHLHLSNYGKFEKQMREEANAIAALLPGDA